MNFDLTSVSSGGMAIERVVFFFDQGLVNWDTYYIDDIGLSASPVSITDAFVGFYLTVFPSPASSQPTINFGLNKSSFVKIEVLDLQGRVVSKIVDRRLSASSHAYRLNDDLANGLYLIKSTVDKSVFTHKITINK